MNPMKWQEIFDSVGLLYVLESAPFAANIAVDENVVWCNQAFVHLVGAKDREEVLGAYAHKFLDPEFLPAVRERVARLHRGESNPPMEVRLIRVDGSPTYAEVRSTPFDARGRRAYVALLTDITERKATENELRDSEERYRHLVDSSPDGIVVSQDGIVLLVNPAYVELMGASSAEELAGRNLVDFYHPDLQDVVRERVLAVSRGLSAPSMEQKVVRLDGVTIDVEAQSEPILYGKKPAALSILRNITERKSAERALVDSEQRYRQLIELLPDPVFVLEGERVVFSNAGTRRLLELAPELKDSPLELVHLAPDEDREVLRGLMDAVAKGRRPKTSEIRLRRNSGHVPVEVRAAAIEIDGRKGALIIARDLSQRHKAEELQSALYRIAQASSRSIGLDALLSEIHDTVGRLMYAKNFFIGLLNEEGTHLTFPYFRDEYDEAPPNPLPLDRTLSGHVIRSGQPLLADDAAIVHLEGQNGVITYGRMAKSWIGVPLVRGTTTFGILVVQSYDATIQHTPADRDLLTFVSGHVAETIERKRKDDQIQSLAYLDSLTGLPNRFLFDDRLDTALALAERNRTPVAVLFVDLDRFKLVNDTLGHSVGDGVLRLVATRLASCLRESDTLARRGGDEFLAILPDTDQRGALLVAQKLVDALRAPLDAAGNELVVTASVGVAIFPDNGADRDGLLKAADLAMYGAKEMGRDTHQFFSAPLREDVERRVSMERGLRNAIAKSRLEVYFQPIVDCGTRRPVTLEALVRWPDPSNGTTTLPSEFIPLAEHTGLIVPLGDLVLRRAVQAMKTLPEIDGQPLNLAVNVSVRQLSTSTFVEDVLAVLEAESFPSARLHIEITETAALSEGQTIGEHLRRLKQAGATIAIDDFGVGHSSLARLRQMPVDMLKIDASFIRDMIEDPDDAAIANAVVSLGRALNMRVVAEGVERIDQQLALESWGCTLMQGYLYTRPLPLPELSIWLRQFS